MPRLPSMPVGCPWTSAYFVTPPREISFVQLVAKPVLAERCGHSCCLCGIGRLPLAQTMLLKDAQGEAQCALQSQAASALDDLFRWSWLLGADPKAPENCAQKNVFLKKKKKKPCTWCHVVLSGAEPHNWKQKKQVFS